jgi:hypothetical protein
MAINSDLRSMAIEAIDECLATAEHCVNTRKGNGGVYGYPSILLLFCVIDALSNYVGYGKNTFRAARLVIPGLSENQIKDLKDWFRNLPAHQCVIMPGTLLSDDPSGAPIEFNANGEPTQIRVVPFYRAVKTAWDSFDKSRINPTFDQNKAPKTPTTISPLQGASGCNVTTAKP